jgi:hypothetical protein
MSATLRRGDGVFTGDTKAGVLSFEKTRSRAKSRDHKKGGCVLSPSYSVTARQPALLEGGIRMFQNVQKLFLVLIAVAALVVSSGVPVIAAEPTQLPPTICFDPNDHIQRADARAACDTRAEELGFKHGFLLPCQLPGLPPPGPVFCFCLESEKDPYICFGLGP